MPLVGLLNERAKCARKSRFLLRLYSLSNVDNHPPFMESRMLLRSVVVLVCSLVALVGVDFAPELEVVPAVTRGDGAGGSAMSLG